MTCIEFFDKESIEDVCTCFAANADTVIFIGKEKNIMEKYVHRYERVFSDRGIKINFDIIAVKIDDLNDIVNKITHVIEQRFDKEESFVFDLTGGEDLCLVAMGIVFERFKDIGIQMHRFNLRNNRITDCDSDGELISEYEAPMISIQENVRVFGGDVIPYNPNTDHGSFFWNMSDDFINDIESMWAIHRLISKSNSIRSWNKQIKMFEAIESCGEVAGMTSKAEISVLEAYLADEGDEYKLITGIVDRLNYYKLAQVNVGDNSIIITYKNKQVKRCLTKAGQALELIVYLFALQAVDKQKQPVYNDVMNGVYIDWDGDIHTEQDGFDTENEIDVMMMHGTVPIFISCKNGKIDMDELYKLNAVATKFGGKYARKILVATSLGKGKFASFFRQRAKDMSIDLLEPVYYSEKTKRIECLSDDEFKEEINHAWSYITRRDV